MLASLVLLIAALSMTSCANRFLARDSILEAEKEATTHADIEDDDIVEVNVGGELVSTRRSTFLAAPEGTFLNTKFNKSGRWPDDVSKKDSQGRIFLDYSPRLFGLVLSYLRTKKNSEPGAVLKPPKVPQEDVQEFLAMVDFLRLEGMLPLGTRHIPLAMRAFYGNASVVPPVWSRQYGNVSVETVDVGTLVTQTQRGPAAFVGEEPLPEQSCTWKVTIHYISSGRGDSLGIGVIGKSSPTNAAAAAGVLSRWADNTTQMWLSKRHSLVYSGGNSKDCSNDRWPGCPQQALVYVNGKPSLYDDGPAWQVGDVAIIRLDAKQGILKMHHMRLGRTFQITGIVGEHEWRIHIYLNGAESQVLVTEATSAEALLVD